MFTVSALVVKNNRATTRAVIAAAGIALLTALADTAPAQAAPSNNLYLTSGTRTSTASDNVYSAIFAGKDASGQTQSSPGNPYVATWNVVAGTSVSTSSAYNTSTINLSGGTISGVTTYGASTLNMSGGSITGAISLFDNSVVNLSGTNFSFQSTGRSSDTLGSFTGFVLSGKLTDGTSVNGVTVKDYDGGLSVGDTNTGALRFASAVVVPEANTAALLSLALPLLGVTAVVRRKKK